MLTHLPGYRGDVIVITSKNVIHQNYNATGVVEGIKSQTKQIIYAYKEAVCAVLLLQSANTQTHADAYVNTQTHISTAAFLMPPRCCISLSCSCTVDAARLNRSRVGP